MFWRRLAGDYQGMGDEMIERELIEDIESRLGMVAHNLRCVTSVDVANVARCRIDLEAAYKQWLTLRTKLQAAGVVSNVGVS
jgi:hypothetical protein